MVVTPLAIVTEVIDILSRYQGAPEDETKSFIAPLPLIVSTPVDVFNDQMTLFPFAPQVPLYTAACT